MNTSTNSTNSKRCARALIALRSYAQSLGDGTVIDIERGITFDALQDLVTDCLHLAQHTDNGNAMAVSDEAFRAMCDRAFKNYEEEADQSKP